MQQLEKAAQLHKIETLQSALPLQVVDFGTWRGNSHVDPESHHAEHADRTTPMNETDGIGFCVASVPQPDDIPVLLAGAVAFGIWRRRTTRG